MERGRAVGGWLNGCRTVKGSGWSGKEMEGVKGVERGRVSGRMNGCETGRGNLDLVGKAIGGWMNGWKWSGGEEYVER